LIGISRLANFQTTYLSVKDTVIGTISDFQKGESYLTNSKLTQSPQTPVTKLVEVIPLQAIKTISLDFQGQVHTIRECPASVFDAFVTQFMEGDDISNVNREVWNPFQRWRMINFLLDDKALEVQGTMLVEVETTEPEVVAQPEVQIGVR
jgi:hypothetical protein